MNEDQFGPAGMVDALEKIAGRRHVLCSEPDRVAYARDLWPRSTIKARAGKTSARLPCAVVQPANEAEVAEVVRCAEAFEVALIPYGAGSGVCGGALAESPAITVDMKRIRHLEVDKNTHLARIGPGVIGQHLETELERLGLTMGHYPSSLYCSTVGGYLAGRSAGQYSSRYGKIEDMVESLRVVVGGGEVLDTAQCAKQHGVDLLELLVGSEGTLGVITDSLMRLHPLPRHRWYRGIRVPSIEAGAEAMRALLQGGLRPAVVRLYDEIDTLMASKGEEPSESSLLSRLLERAHQSIRSTSPSGQGGGLRALVERTARGLMGRVLGAPMLLSRATTLLPSGCLLIVGFEGDEEAVALESVLAAKWLQRFGEDMGAGPGEHWHSHRMNISYKMSPLMDTGAFSDTMEVSTDWGNLMHLYHTVKNALAPHVLCMAHFSHAYVDGCSIYFTFAGFADCLEETLALYDRTWKAGLTAVASTGASIAHHHGVGKSKSAFTAEDHPGGAPLMRGLSLALDPAGVFNPGKVWPAATLMRGDKS
ncbi:MAG: hypothetical protein AUK47_06785 [Deltaproteobacteria bacterium CG2_30_63_29]|nr:MAG: hypothetical protein AUK47_06785 [Deltaproteobacteria bacterium CG2_30_63_29]